ncbi:MarR family transcriptional regulator [Paludicola sp. MB14-C6]|uniref:MarR family transcriptional regulator n=1 Tax=Paludihabitans sp. MB14-C6 TaxID=3070656 RepID=UPI0027DB6F8E|nr:MarR family transcriptional regulator [Paludicola sp. MB14-C6]WMJ22006.1 MarR family transcriptional regulator [Paludicola sp. MB14-C6]
MTQEIFEAIKALQQCNINCINVVSHLTHAQTIVLLTIGDYISKKSAPPQPSYLSEVLRVAPASITPVLNKLDDTGFIERIYSKQDRRQVFLQLTKNGEQEYKQMSKQINAYYAKVIDEVGIDLIKQFIDFGKKIETFNSNFIASPHIPPFINE